MLYCLQNIPHVNLVHLLNIAPPVNSVFSFATDVDVRALQSNVKQLLGFVEQNVYSVRKSEHALSAFVTISQHRLDLLAQTLLNFSMMHTADLQLTAYTLGREVFALSEMNLHMFQIETLARQITTNLMNLIDDM